MSRPKFLADNDLRDQIVKGVHEREPLIEFPRMRDLGLAEFDDGDALDWAADHGFVIVSHDVNTMSAAASMRLKMSRPMAGLLLIQQLTRNVRAVIDDLVLIGLAAEAEELINAIRFLPV
jgi:predicted nuclease of predicted toxin-antitoxin system